MSKVSRGHSNSSCFISEQELTKVQTISPKHRSTRLNSPRRHGHSSRKISFVVFRLSGVLRMDLFTLILCGVCLSSHEPSLSKPGAALFPTRRSSRRGFRHTISHGYSGISDAAAGDLQGPHQHPANLKTLPIAYSLSPFGEDRPKFGRELPNDYYFQSSDVMRLSLIIHLLHRVTLVTQTLFWSQRSNHDRRLNKLHTISFPPLPPAPSLHGRHLILCMCFSAILHPPQRHEKRIRDLTGGKKNEWGNTNVDNSIYIVRAKCELSHFEECRSRRLFAENVHNSIETWPRLRLLPLSRHPSREYFMCHHLPVMESKAEVMSVSCPGDPLQRPRLGSSSGSWNW